MVTEMLSGVVPAIALHALGDAQIGWMMDDHERGEKCPMCVQLGESCASMLREEQERRTKERAERSSIARFRWLVDHSGLLLEERKKSFETFEPRLNGTDNQPALEALRKYAENIVPGAGISLLVWGHKGTGKGHLVCAAGMRILDRGFRVVKYVVQDLLDEAIKHFGLRDETRKRLEAAEVLILDELAVPVAGQWEEMRAYRVFYSILNTAICMGQNVLATSNYSVGELADELSKVDPKNRLLDRIRGDFFLIEMKGDSVRPVLRERKRPGWLPGDRP